MKTLLPSLVMLSTITLAAGETFEAPTYQAGQALPSPWQTEGAVELTAEESVSGGQSLKVGPEGKATLGTTPAQAISFIDLQILPVAAETEQLNLQGARLGFAPDGKILIFEGASTEGRPAQNVQYQTSNGAAETWVRVSVRLDPIGKKWDLYIDGQPAEANLALATATEALTLTAASIGPTYLDDYSQTEENPLFADQDKDGQPDAEEKANGLNPFTDDRAGDLDGDGLSNVDEFFAGTSPRAPGALTETAPRIYYVDNLHGASTNSGNHSYAVGNDGPMASLGAAMAAVPNHSLIILLKGTGTYDEGTMGVPGKHLTIKPVDSITIK